MKKRIGNHLELTHYNCTSVKVNELLRNKYNYLIPPTVCYLSITCIRFLTANTIMCVGGWLCSVDTA